MSTDQTRPPAEIAFSLPFWRFERSLSQEQREDWANTTFGDLQETLLAIQRVERPTRTNENFRDIESFITALEANVEIVEAYVDVRRFEWLFWGPIKCIIQVTSDSAVDLSSILDAYRQVGERMLQFTQYHDPNETNPTILETFGLFFGDILDFHQLLLDSLRMQDGASRRLSDVFWHVFITEFRQILKNMAKHRRLLKREATLVGLRSAHLADIPESLEEDERLQNEIFVLRKDERLLKEQFVLTWLAAADVRLDLERGQLARKAHPESANWLLNKDSFQSWYSPQSRTVTPLLWINGGPGSGKTVLASTVINEVYKLPDANLAYFFFRRADVSTRSFTAMARALLSQLLRIEGSILAELYEAAVSDGSPSLSIRETAESLLDTCLRRLKSYYIILDGLDECPHDEQEAIVSWLRKLVSRSTSKPQRFAIFSRLDSSLSAHLATLPALGISIEGLNHSDIENYCEHEAFILASRFGLEVGEARSIASTVSERAHGTFLLAKLAMENLSNQASVADLRHQMKPEVLTQSFDRLYKPFDIGSSEPSRPDQDFTADAGSPTPSEVSWVFSVESVDSVPSSNTSYPDHASEDTEISVWHITEFLITQDAFADLCQGGFHRKDLDPARFANNLRRMLKAFGKKLLNETESRNAQLTAQLIVRDARRIAALVRSRYDPTYRQTASYLSKANLASMPESERRVRIENYLDKQGSADAEGTGRLEIPRQDSDSEGYTDSEASGEAAVVSSLEEIEFFFTSSRALQDLLETLATFLKLPKRQEIPDPDRIRDESLPTMPEYPALEIDISKSCSTVDTPVASVLTQLYEELSRWTTRIGKPSPGLHRVHYNCGCGELMSIDVKERKRGALELLQSQLSLTVVQETAPSDTGPEPTGVPTLPQRAHITSTSASGRSNIAHVPEEGISGNMPNSNIPPVVGQQYTAQADTGDATARFLLLCVNTRNLTRLLHVDLRYIQNDQLLFDRIRRSYRETRRHASWHYGLLTPKWLANWRPAWSDWLESVHLRIPRSAELIEFRLVPFHTNICPDKIRLALPPEHQVKVEKNYHYDPCPTDVEVLSIPKFSHLLKPGVHSYDFWLKTFPKKLRAELTNQPAVVGWGLIINEGWDWVVLLSSILALLILTGVVVVLYAVFTHDQASAFGLGAYAISIVTLLLTVKYWAWQEHEG